MLGATQGGRCSCGLGVGGCRAGKGARAFCYVVCRLPLLLDTAAVSCGDSMSDHSVSTGCPIAHIERQVDDTVRIPRSVGCKE